SLDESLHDTRRCRPGSALTLPDWMDYAPARRYARSSYRPGTRPAPDGPHLSPRGAAVPGEIHCCTRAETLLYILRSRLGKISKIQDLTAGAPTRRCARNSSRLGNHPPPGEFRPSRPGAALLGHNLHYSLDGI